MKTTVLVRGTKHLSILLLAGLVAAGMLSFIFDSNVENRRIDVLVTTESEIGENFTFLSSSILLESGNIDDWISSNPYRFETSILPDNRSRFEIIALRPGQMNLSISIYDEGNYSPALWLEPEFVSISYASVPDCHTISGIDSSVRWTINRDGFWESTFSNNGPWEEAEFTFSSVAGPTLVSADLIVKPGSSGSHAYVICDSPEFNVDGVTISASGRTVLGLHRFGVLEAKVRYDTHAQVNISVPFMLTMDSARGAASVRNGTISFGGISREMSGTLRIVDSSCTSVTILKHPWRYQSLSISLEALNSIAVQEDTRLGSKTYYVNSEIVRILATFLILSALGLVLVIWHNRVVTESGEQAEDECDVNSSKRGEDTHPDRRVRRPQRERAWVVPWALFVAVLVIVGANSYASPLLNKPPAYYFAHYPTQLEIYMEEGVNQEFIASVVDLFVGELEHLIGFDLEGEVEYHQFDDDGLTIYYRDEDDIWEPTGQRDLDTLGIVLSGRATLTLIFHTGSGWDREDNRGFVGLGPLTKPVSAYPISDQPSSLGLLETMIHEFGHNLGFDHNQCSHIMNVPTGDSIHAVHRYSESVESQEASRFIEALRLGEVPVIPEWGSPIISVLNSSSPAPYPNATRQVSTVLYHDTQKGSYRDIWYRVTVNETSGELSEDLIIRSLNPDGLQLGWSGEEAYHIHEARTSSPTRVPEVRVSCESP